MVYSGWETQFLATILAIYIYIYIYILFITPCADVDVIYIQYLVELCERVGPCPVVCLVHLIANCHQLISTIVEYWAKNREKDCVLCIFYSACLCK